MVHRGKPNEGSQCCCTQSASALLFYLICLSAIYLKPRLFKVSILALSSVSSSLCGPLITGVCGCPGGFMPSNRELAVTVSSI